MKKNLLGLLLLAPALAHAQTSFPYTVKGSLGKLDAPAKLYLVRGAQLLDSTTLKNGAFEFKGTTEVPKEVELVLQRNGKLRDAFSGSQDRTRLYLEAGPVVVTSPDSLPKARIKGGPVTADYQRLQASLKPVLDKIKATGATYQHASPEERKSPAFMARMKTQYEAIKHEYEQLDKAFIQANPTSWVSLNVLVSLGSVPQYAEVAPLYAALSSALKNSPPGREYGEMLQGLQAVAIGAQAPNFTQQTPDGKPVSLADYRGKYVLVDFWASWCSPCRAENPTVAKAYQTYKGRNFDVLGISLDLEKTRDKWVQAIAEDHLPWTQVSDLRGFENEAAQRYSVHAIPQNFLIDPAGKIVAVNLRGDELSATLARFIK